MVPILHCGDRCAGCDRVARRVLPLRAALSAAAASARV